MMALQSPPNASQRAPVPVEVKENNGSSVERKKRGEKQKSDPIIALGQVI